LQRCEEAGLPGWRKVGLSFVGKRYGRVWDLPRMNGAWKGGRLGETKREKKSKEDRKVMPERGGKKKS